ncbi:hypothetical protein MMC25_003001 [Agyrium rufum]|nr:hypothetical protein [Agyrium rufum]
MYWSSLIPQVLLLAGLANTHALPKPTLNSRTILRTSALQFVNLRIEGLNNTIYEAPIVSGPRTVTTASGGTHLCDGTQDGQNPTPGNTPTDALDAASKLANFPFDGTYQAEFEDFFITSIGTSTNTDTMFWGLLVNYQFTPVGGCQFETKTNDQVLWAFDAFSKTYFLKVTPAAAEVKVGQKLVVTVSDGTTGTLIQGATIDGVLTNAAGQATLTFKKKGIYAYKAERSDSIRSNALVVAVV